MALERCSVGMVKECRKNRLAFDSQCFVFKRAIISYDRVVPSFDILVGAQPSPKFAKNPITGCVCSASVGVISGRCILRGW